MSHYDIQIWRSQSYICENGKYHIVWYMNITKDNAFLHHSGLIRTRGHFDKMVQAGLVEIEKELDRNARDISNQPLLIRRERIRRGNIPHLCYPHTISALNEDLRHLYNKRDRLLEAQMVLRAQ